MLDLAEALNPLLEQRKKRLEEGLEEDEDVADTTLQLVFFDGEEAFVAWTAKDSIYGARYGELSRTGFRMLMCVSDISQRNGRRPTSCLTTNAD